MLFNIHHMLSSEHSQKKLKETLKYNFIELNDTAIEQMMTELHQVYRLIHRTANLTQEELDEYKDLMIPCDMDKRCLNFEHLNALYLSEILAVFQRYEHTRNYPMTHDAYLDKKAENLAKVIQATNPELKKSDFPKLLDIGCGDCQMTARVSQKLGAEPTGVDLKGPAEDSKMWAGDAGVANGLGNSIVYYDGLHLVGSLKERTENYNELFDVVTFNHVLHHYPDRKSQIDGLQQAIAVLKKGGVLLFSEHATVLDDEFIELQHVLFDVKAEVLSAKVSEKSDLLSLCEAELVHYEEEKHQANYFSGPLLVKISEALGLKPIISVERTKDGEYDASRAVITGFMKVTPTLSPQELEGFKPIPLNTLMKSGALQSLTAEDKDLGLPNTSEEHRGYKMGSS